MTPFYQHNGITIYCGDCLEVLPTLSSIDSLIADPPYGINSVTKSGETFTTSNAAKTTKNHKPVIGDDKKFNPAHLLSFPKVALFGANHYSKHLPSSSCWLVWDKRDGINSNTMADCELVWTNIDSPSRLFHHTWMGMIRASKDERVHPNQKPVVVMRWVINQVSPDGAICDPYMGSGTTLRAAQDMGLQAVGIELDEEYCQIAVQRLRQQSFSFPARATNKSLKPNYSQSELLTPKASED